MRTITSQDPDHPLFGEWCDKHQDEMQDHDCDEAWEIEVPTKMAKELNLYDRVKWGSGYQEVVGLFSPNVNRTKIDVTLRVGPDSRNTVTFPFDHELELKP